MRQCKSMSTKSRELMKPLLVRASLHEKIKAKAQTSGQKIQYFVEQVFKKALK